MLARRGSARHFLLVNCVAATAGESDARHPRSLGWKPPRRGVVHGAPKLLTVQPHAVEAEPEIAGQPSVERFTHALSETDLAVASSSESRPRPGGVSLAEAKVVVSAGRGAGSAEGFGIIEELAGLLEARSDARER